MAGRTVPVMRRWTAGEVDVGAYMNANVQALGNFLLGPPVCEVRQTVAQSMTTAATTALLWDTEILDPDGIHSTVSATDTFTIAVAGSYLAIGKYCSNAPASAVGLIQGTWRLNGSPYGGAGGELPFITTSQIHSVIGFAVIPCAVGDALTFTGFQNSGGTVATQVASVERQSNAALYWVSR